MNAMSAIITTQSIPETR